MTCYGQEWARKSHQDPAERFVTAKSGQKEPPRPSSMICYGQEWARKSHQDPAVRFVPAKSGMDQKESPRPGSTICYGQEWARKSHQDPAVRFVTAKSGPERATKTRQYDLLRPRVGQKDPPRRGSAICYGQEWARKSHQDPAVRFVTAKSGPERASMTRQYDLLRPRLGQKELSRPGSTICYGQEWARKSHQDPAARFVTAKSGPERATKTQQYDLLRPRVGQKEPPRPGSTICYGQEWARKSHQDPAVRFVLAKSGPERARTRQYDLLRPRVGQNEPIYNSQEWPERATKTRQYDLLWPRVGQKQPPRPGSTICYGQEWARESHQDPAVRFVMVKNGQKEPPTPGRTICCCQETRQYDFLRPRMG